MQAKPAYLGTRALCLGGQDAGKSATERPSSLQLFLLLRMYPCLEDSCASSTRTMTEALRQQQICSLLFDH